MDRDGPVAFFFWAYHILSSMARGVDNFLISAVMMGESLSVTVDRRGSIKTSLERVTESLVCGA